MLENLVQFSSTVAKHCLEVEEGSEILVPGGPGL